MTLALGAPIERHAGERPADRPKAVVEAVLLGNSSRLVSASDYLRQPPLTGELPVPGIVAAGSGEQQQEGGEQTPAPPRQAQARAPSTTPALLCRSAFNTVATMPSASRPASAYCFSGLSCSWKRSGRRIVRSLRPASISPSSLAK